MIGEKMKGKHDANLDLFMKMIRSSIKSPELTPDRILIISGNENDFIKIITPSRMDLIRSIKKNKPKSIGELSREVKRPIESVSRDLRILNNYGFLEFVKVGKEKVPEVKKDAILIRC